MPIAFRARARTIDHLGREQIADCPTAISELWKNAYDAYATEVALHIFDGEVPIAAVVDNGHGMDRAEFIEKWLVIGTDAKESSNDVSDSDRLGLPARVKQGRKGIGRLSVGALGPLCVVISKRIGSPHLAAMIDWRIFENPYLSLDEVLIPFEEFCERSELPSTIAKLYDDLIDNVWVKDAKSERKEPVERAWERWDEESIKQKKTRPSEAISKSALSSALEEEHFSVFDVFAGSSNSGTALFVIGINHELSVWVDSGVVSEDPEIELNRKLLTQTLSNFVDPFGETTGDFRYRVEVHKRSGVAIPVCSDEVFGWDDLRGLEHYVEGRFDGYGIFKGTARAFSRKPVEFTYSPQRPLPQAGAGYVGPFDFCIGSFEVEARSSTHPEEFHRALKDRAEQFSGLAVYRSGLRVMPYGRVDSDYFGMEERRSMHAGRHFWAHRRSFGRVALDRLENPNLKDKAGREGLIDNIARRELRLLVIGVLRESADRYFGSDADLRKTVLPEVQAGNKEEKDAQDAVKRVSREFRAALREQKPKLDSAIGDLDSLSGAVSAVTQNTGPATPDVIRSMSNRLDAALSQQSSLRLPRKPAKLRTAEADYRRYRDGYEQFRARLGQIQATWAAWVDLQHPVSHVDTARSAFARHQAFIGRTVTAYERRIGDLLRTQETSVDARSRADRNRYHSASASVLADLENRVLSLPDALLQLEHNREAIYEEVKHDYDAYIDALSQLEMGVDITGAMVRSEERREELEHRMEQVFSLAQLGITVEIIGHELNELDAQIDRSLKKMSPAVQSTHEFRAASQAHRALVERLSFLSPLRIAGISTKENITGEEIFSYLGDFFRQRLVDRNTSLEATRSFLEFTVPDFTHRVYPVFVNLINNSLYWLTFSEDRRLLLDRVGDYVFVSDSGPGVDADDLPRLFELYFSRRAEGRGVGLYLSRVNLRAGQHDIEYVDAPERKRLPGANFAISFRGIS